jgi:pro-apoptotic serine protease NMA111
VVSLHPIPLVVTSRYIVEVSVCDLRLAVGHRHIPATIVHLGQIVVLTFDPRCLSPDAKVPKISVRRDLKLGDDVDLLVQDQKHQLLQKRTKIVAISAIRTTHGDPPRARISNTEGIKVADPFHHFQGGVLRDPLDSAILALWLGIGYYDGGNYTYENVGVNINDYILPIIDSLKLENNLELRHSGYEFLEMDMANATDLGLRYSRAVEIEKIAAAFGAVPRPIMVTGTLVPRFGETGGLVVGDVLLEINGNSVGRIRDVKEFEKHDEVEVVVLRDGQEMRVKVGCQLCQDETIQRLVSWCGANFHETQPMALEQATLEFFNTLKREGLGDPLKKVYVGGQQWGSPADDNIRSETWLLEVDGKKVESLDDLLDVLLKLEKGEEDYVRVKTLGPKGDTRINSVKPCPTFFPAWILEKKEDKWIRTEIA